MDLANIVTRIKAKLPLIKQVQYAENLHLALEDAAKQQHGDAWLYVVPGKENASASQSGSLVTHQRVRAEFGVLIITKNARDRRGKAAGDDAASVRVQLRSALHGWLPADCEQPLEIGASGPQGFNEFINVWLDGYTTSYSIRTGANP